MPNGKTPEEIKEMMINLVKAVDAADVPQDLRVAAFEKGFDALMGGGSSGTEDGPQQRDSDVPTDRPSLAAIAKKLNLDSELVEEIYYVNGDDLGLALAASKFHPKKAAATAQIALLIAAGRQAGGWDEWTDTSRIRDVTREYGRFDQANYASTIRRMGNVFSFRGRAREVEVRVTRPGYEQAANLARELGEM